MNSSDRIGRRPEGRRLPVVVTTDRARGDAGSGGSSSRTGRDGMPRTQTIVRRDASVAGATALRSAPDASAEQVTQSLRGEPLAVISSRGGWTLVRTAYDYPGWIRTADLTDAVDPAWMPEPRAGDPISEARDYLGVPYLWGGMTDAGIDCSGLVHIAYRRLGVLIPRDADQQEAAARHIAPSDVQRGDLVTYGDELADHVAFWLGDGRILHAVGRRGVEAGVAELDH